MDHPEHQASIPEGLTPAQALHFDALKQALAANEQRAKQFEEAWSTLFDQNKHLREENHRIQQGYENLRIQKGGFGFKMLMLSGIGGFVTALLLCFVYLKLKPKDAHTQALHNFRRTHLFEYEWALSKSQYETVRTSLEKETQNPDNELIKTEIEMLRELVEAAEKGSQRGGGQ